MGFLLLQYEYQRASREVSVHERAGIRLDDQVDRYTKRIENMQSVFDKAQDRLTKNWDRKSQLFSAEISKATCYSANGLSAINDFNALINGIVIGGIRLSAYVQASTAGLSSSPSAQDIMAVLSNYTAQAKSVMSSLIEDAKEADLLRLQAQQSEQLDPISEKEKDLEAKQNLENTLCEVWTTRRDNAKQRLGQDIGNSMASFGLKG